MSNELEAAEAALRAAYDVVADIPYEHVAKSVVRHYLSALDAARATPDAEVIEELDRLGEPCRRVSTAFSLYAVPLGTKLFLSVASKENGRAD